MANTMEDKLAEAKEEIKREGEMAEQQACDRARDAKDVFERISKEAKRRLKEENTGNLFLLNIYHLFWNMQLNGEK